MAPLLPSCTPGQQGFLAQVLEPLGFSRHFFRTEVRNDTGSLVFLDFQQPVNLTTWNRCICHKHLEHSLVSSPAGGCGMSHAS